MTTSAQTAELAAAYARLQRALRELSDAKAALTRALNQARNRTDEN